jgi:hypothetical protein
MRHGALMGHGPNEASSTVGRAPVFDLVFVILCVTALLGLLANAALHEDDDTGAVRVRSNRPQPSE